MVDDLNARFRRGNNYNPSSLHNAGLLVHQFDFMDDGNPDGQPWMPGTGWWMHNGQYMSTWDRADRISTTIINHNMTAGLGGNIPIYSFGLGGIIMSPRHNHLLCSYAYDVGSLERICNPRGVGQSCVPGCTHPDFWNNDIDGNVRWCTGAPDVDEWPCAWRPTDLPKMLREREVIRASGGKPWHKGFDDHKYYVEMIFESQAFIDQLPASIEAVFYLHVDRSRWAFEPMGINWPDVEADCVDATSGPKCRDYATRAHTAMLEHFQLTAEQLPLLRFDPYNWDCPFSWPGGGTTTSGAAESSSSCGGA